MEYTKNRKKSEEDNRKEREAAFRSALKQSPSIGGIWLLCGPESYLSKEYALRMRKHVIPNPELAFFDYVRISGFNSKGTESENSISSAEQADYSETDFPLVNKLREACETMPVMNEGKLIEITEIPFDSISKKNLSVFCETLKYASSLPGVTILMQCTEDEFPVISSEGKKPKWTGTRDMLEKAGVSIVLFDFQEERTLIPWCEKHFCAEGVSADQNVITAMLRRCGSAMFSLDSEIRKLSHYALSHGRATISTEDILSVTSETIQPENFAIQNAVRSRDVPAMLRASNEAKLQKESAIVLSAQISGTLSEIWRVSEMSATGKAPAEISSLLKIKEYPVKLDLRASKLYPRHVLLRLLNRCEETDTALKSSFVDEYILLERLICEFSIGVYD